MQLLSPAFINNQPIPTKYAIGGINPPMLIQEIPSQTKSLNLMVHNPDTPNMGFAHWLVWKIPQSAIQGINGMGTIGWVGPALPSGTHRYFFELYALDTVLDLPQGGSRDELQDTMKSHTLEKTELISKYSA